MLQQQAYVDNYYAGMQQAQSANWQICGSTAPAFVGYKSEPPRPKTFREEMQADVNEWLKDVI